MPSRIAFIGLGNMGRPMARRLVAAGHSVQGTDLSDAAREAAALDGTKVGTDLRAIVDGADIVFSMLPAGPHVAAAYLGDGGTGGGLLDLVGPDTLLVDCSTIDVTTARRLAKAAEERGIAMLDAPVSGGTAGADAGTLTFMVGGAPEAVERARPILAVMGKSVVHTGGAGTGQAAKLCNNLILGVSMIAVSEAFTLADALGLDRQTLFDVASKSSGQCWSLTSYCPVPGPVPASPANRDYAPGFTSAMMLKDLRLAQQAAADAGRSAPLSAMAALLFDLCCRSGYEADDFSGIIRILKTN